MRVKGGIPRKPGKTVLAGTLLCFGDSNTFGTKPIASLGTTERYPEDIRWPTVACAALGPGWRLVEEGLPGRTTCLDDPTAGAHLNGVPGLKIALLSHWPFDVLTIMLGTNDFKACFGATPEAVAAGAATLLKVAAHPDITARTGPFRTLLICPPHVDETGALAADFFGGAKTSRRLAPLFAELAAANGVGFLDAAEVVSPSPLDGVHFEAGAHEALGAAVAKAVARL